MERRINMKQLEEKWAPLISQQDNLIENDKIRKSTALMLENQYGYLREHGLVNENTTTDGLNRSGGYGTSGDFHKIAVPMVRRTFPNLIAHDIVGVQPMTGPVGIAFALRFKAMQEYNAPSIGGNHAPSNELGYNNIDPNYSGPMSTAAGEALGSKADTSVSDGDPLTPGPQMGHGLGVGDGTTAKEVGFTIEKKQVDAKTRKLRSRWSLEVAQDIKAMHGLDLEEEMMDILSYEITAEVDREIVGEIRAAANKNANSNVTGKLGLLDWNNASHFDGRWEHEKYRNVFNLLNRKANRIAVDTRRGSGNFVVANPTICAALEGTSAFTIAPVNNDLNTTTQGISFIGTIDNRMRVYQDTFTETDEFTVGYKGPSAYDAGIIYLPYIQLMMSKATFEDSFNPAIGLMSRYGLMTNLFGASNYYVRCIVNNMP